MRSLFNFEWKRVIRQVLFINFFFLGGFFEVFICNDSYFYLVVFLLFGSGFVGGYWFFFFIFFYGKLVGVYILFGEVFGNGMGVVFGQLLIVIVCFLIVGMFFNDDVGFIVFFKGIR